MPMPGMEPPLTLGGQWAHYTSPYTVPGKSGTWSSVSPPFPFPSTETGPQGAQAGLQIMMQSRMAMTPDICLPANTCFLWYGGIQPRVSSVLRQHHTH